MIIELKQTFNSRYGLPAVSKVETDIFTFKYYDKNCFDNNTCNDICCSEGVLMDIRSFEQLLKYKDKPEFKHIDWDYYFKKDLLAAGGLGCDSRVVNGTCAFRNTGGRGCLIHKFSLESGMDFRDIKFLYCCFFPADIFDGELLSYSNLLRRKGYLNCEGGNSTVYETSKNDIEYYFGQGLINELDNINANLSR